MPGGVELRAAHGGGKAPHGLLGNPRRAGRLHQVVLRGGRAAPARSRPRGRRGERRAAPRSAASSSACCASAPNLTLAAPSRRPHAGARSAAAPTTRRDRGHFLQRCRPISASPADLAQRLDRRRCRPTRAPRDARCARGCRRRAAPPARRDVVKHLHDRVARARVARLRAPAERRVCLVGADLHDRAQRVALHGRFGVVEQRARSGSASAPPNARSNSTAVRRTAGFAGRAQLVRIGAAGGAKAQQHFAQPLDGRTLFAGERFGQWPDRRPAQSRGRTPKPVAISSSRAWRMNITTCLISGPLAQAIEAGASRLGKWPIVCGGDDDASSICCASDMLPASTSCSMVVERRVEHLRHASGRVSIVSRSSSTC